jgi:hypothetical protein
LGIRSQRHGRPGVPGAAWVWSLPELGARLAEGDGQVSGHREVELGQLVPLEEVAARGLWTCDGAYRALRRSGLPYLLVGTRLGARCRLHRRIAVSPRTAVALLTLRAESAKRRGTWTASDSAGFGLPTP